MNKDYLFDYYVATGKKYSYFSNIRFITRMFSLRYVYFARKAIHAKTHLFRFLNNYMRFRLRRKYGIEVFINNIGKGFRMVHAFNITISNKAFLGENVTVFKGVTIGEVYVGNKAGAPKIGNNVWIGPNATIVGKIHIGDDVLIAPNAFINNDVPSHSIVIGNPATIHRKDNATAGYLRKLEDLFND